MADRNPPRPPLALSPEALFRYQIVSAVKARELSGQGIDAAVRAVAAQTHLTLAGEHKTAAVRSIYRWLADLDRDGPTGIETARPAPTGTLAPEQRQRTSAGRSPSGVGVTTRLPIPGAVPLGAPEIAREHPVTANRFATNPASGRATQQRMPASPDDSSR